MSADVQPESRIPFDPMGIRPRVFAGATHEEASARLQYLVESGQRCALVTGPRASGKSTLLRHFAEEGRSARLPAVFINLMNLEAAEMLERLIERLGTASHAGHHLPTLWRDASDALVGQRQSRNRCTLIFDHIDRAPSECQQALRRLMVQEPSDRGAIFVLGFSGDAFPIVPRVWREWGDLRVDVLGLTPAETAAYAQSLLGNVARCDDLFDDDALTLLHELSAGIPSSIERLCRLALLSALHDEQPHISGHVVAAAMRELSSLRPSA